MGSGVYKQPFSRRQHPKQGFILPMTLAVGLITLLFALLMIERSSQNQRTAIAQASTTQSLAAAEAGVAQLQALFNRYRSLALYCSEKTTSPPCSKEKEPTWQTLAQKVIDSCSATPDEPNEVVQAYARQTWMKVSVDPTAGQFRLLRYVYQPNSTPTPGQPQGTGELTVEGRTHPEDLVRSVTTRLKVTFNLTREPGLNLPGLWIQENAAASILSTVPLTTRIQDSTCPSATSSTVVRRLQAQLQPPYPYQSTPGAPFPQSVLDPFSGSASPQPGVYALPAITQEAALPSPGQTSVTQPKSATRPQGDRRLTYRVAAQNGISIALTQPGAVLKLGTGTETIVLDLEGGLNLQNGGRIKLAEGSRLILYARGAVTLAGHTTTPALEQEGTPAASRVQIYVYPPADNTLAREVNLSGSAPLHLALIAPGSKVTSGAPVQGSIWAKTWNGTGGSLQESIRAADLVDLNVLWPLRMSPLTAWQRQESS